MELVESNQRLPLTLAMFAAVLLLLMTSGAMVAYHVSVQSADTWYWYLSRAAAFTAYEILTASVLLGMSVSNRIWDRWRLRGYVTPMHQFLALMMWPFIALHLAGLYLDHDVAFSLHSLFVPFTASYRTFATGLGTLGLYGMLFLVLSSALSKRIGHKTWRAIHYISLPVFVAVTLHGILAGTSTPFTWAHMLYTISLGGFIVLTVATIRRHAK